MSRYTKNIKVTYGVKSHIENGKRQMGYKTESEYIAYLVAVESWAKRKMTAFEYEQMKEEAKVLDKQLTL